MFLHTAAKGFSKRCDCLYQLQGKSFWHKTNPMKSIFDDTRIEVISRINTFTPAHPAQWGKMNVVQMVKHCILCKELYLGKLKVNRSFLGRMALRKVLQDESPIKQHEPTASCFTIQQTEGDLENEKSGWNALINGYARYNSSYFIHWFFGKMTKEQAGQFAYKHTGHHRCQFTV